MLNGPIQAQPPQLVADALERVILGSRAEEDGELLTRVNAGETARIESDQ
jgi:hypothetical protein